MIITMKTPSGSLRRTLTPFFRLQICYSLARRTLSFLRHLHFAFYIFYFPFFISPLWPAVPYTPTHPDPVLEPWRWRSFPELRGLGLRCLAEAKDGAMWFGVDAGAVRYDGLNWVTYTPQEGLLGAPVTAFCATQDSSVYAGTPLGISRFDGKTWRRVFPPEGDLPWHIYDLMEATNGSLWAGSVWGALRLNDLEKTLYTTEEIARAMDRLIPDLRAIVVPDSVTSTYPWAESCGIAVRTVEWRRSPQGIWALAPGGPGEAAGLQIGDVILSIDGQFGISQMCLYGTPGTPVTLNVRREGRPQPFAVTLSRTNLSGTYRAFDVYDIFEDRSGALWFGLANGAVVRCDIRKVNGPAAWRSYTEADCLDLGRMPKIVQTRDGTLWVVSNGGAIGQGTAGTTGTRWRTFRLSEYGGTNLNSGILETREGSLWICGGWGFLHVLREADRDRGKWTVYKPSETPIPGGKFVRLLEASDGALWIASNGQEAVRLDYNTPRWTAYDSLHFHCETPDGAQWFVNLQKSVVRYDGQTWTQYGPEDGLMDGPVVLIVTRKGGLWAAGTHAGAAATARFDGTRWSLQTHPRLSWSISTGAVCESEDGSLWFGAAQPSRLKGALGGVLKFDGEIWTHYPPPEAPMYTYSIAQTGDGRVWFAGSGGLHCFDGRSWENIAETEELIARPHLNAVHGAPDGHIWVGTRGYGALEYNGKEWRRYDVRDGLADNHVKGIFQTRDGSIWAGTSKGLSRFDGRTWTTHALPPDLRFATAFETVRQSRDGVFWINTFQGLPNAWTTRTIRYQPDAEAPNTEITLCPDQVSQPGNTTLAWTGRDPWNATPSEDIQYAWRLDDGEWSPFSPRKSQILQALPAGAHTFEVKARDRDFNVSPSPAVAQFTVVPPVWQQPWFVGLIILGVGVIGYLASRIVLRDRKLSATNEALKTEIAEREKLDAQIQELRYLYRLRSALGTARSSEEVIRRTGEAMMDVLAATDSAGIRIQIDGKTWQFGQNGENGRAGYERPLVWGDRQRGSFVLQSSVALSEAQERALLDETSAQISRVLEAREMEMQILQSARLVSLGEMAAGVAHELGQPLTVISTTAGDIYQRQIENLALPPEKLKVMMEDVLDVVEHMDEIIDHLRIFSRDTSGEPPARFSVTDVIRAALKLTATQLENHGIALRLDLAADLPPVCGRPQQIEQVFLNLLGNARDALDEKGAQMQRGEISDTAREKRLTVRTRCKADGPRQIAVEITDNGAGIAAADLSRIFEPFFTTKEAARGTGLGLSISYAIVKNHGGQITCESQQGVGATFSVVLPAAEET